MASRTAEGKLGIEEALDQLYAQPPGEFTRVRNALARQLAASGAAQEAAALKGLTRPALAAWALNQAVRSAPEQLEQLLEAGRALRQAQRRVLSGVRDHGLNEAVHRRREAIRALGRVAAKVLEDAGKNPGHYRNDIDATLQAASIEAGAAELLRKGRLAKPLPPPAGFGELAGLAVVPRAPEPPRSEAGEAPKQKKGPRPAELRRLETARTRARQSAEHAASLSRQAEELRAKAEAAKDGADRLKRDAERAARFAAQLVAQADAAAKAAEQAKQTSERRTDALQRLEERLR